MRPLFTLLGLLLAIAAGGTPAHAFRLGQRAPLLTPGPCANVMVKLDFTANDGGGLYCLNGTRYPSFAAIPGATVTRASAKTCATSTGTIVTAPANVLCITDLGVLIEEGRTNSFLNSAAGATQSVTTTAASWTLSFYGTGSIVLSGGCTGTLSGTGASVRVSLTATCTAGSTTLTVSGSTTNVQFEAGSFASSNIVTAGSPATRAADVATITGVVLPARYTWTAAGRALGPTNSSSFPGILSDNLDAGLYFHRATAGLGANIGVGYNAEAGSVSAGQLAKFAFRAAANDANLAGNGVLGTSSTTYVPTVGPVTVIVGANGGSSYWNDFVKQIALYPSAFYDAQLQGLTQ